MSNLPCVNPITHAGCLGRQCRRAAAAQAKFEEELEAKQDEQDNIDFFNEMQPPETEMERQIRLNPNNLSTLFLSYPPKQNQEIETTATNDKDDKPHNGVPQPIGNAYGIRNDPNHLHVAAYAKPVPYQLNANEGPPSMTITFEDSTKMMNNVEKAVQKLQVGAVPAKDVVEKTDALTVSDIKVEKHTESMDAYVANLIAKDQALKAAKNPQNSKKRTAKDMLIQE